jgi:hypothetical protein
MDGVQGNEHQVDGASQKVALRRLIAALAVMGQMTPLTAPTLDPSQDID